MAFDLIVRSNDIGNLSGEDIFIYSISFVYELLLFAVSVNALKRYPFLPSVFIAFYLIIICCAYSFYFYFGTFPGINTFSFLFFSPANSFEIIKAGVNFIYLAFVVTVISLALWGYSKAHTRMKPMGKLKIVLCSVFIVVFTLVLNNNLRLKDNRTLPFTNMLFAAEHGFLDYRNNSKIVQIGNRTFSINEKPKNLTADFNVILIMNESLSPFYFMEYGSKYNTDSLLYSRIQNERENFYLFRNAYTNSTVTAVSVPFTLAGLNPVQGKHQLIQMPLIYDYLKHHYNNVNTAFITSWSYDDYPNFKSFFNSENLDRYIYREKIDAPKVVDMGGDDTIITRRFGSFLESLNPGNRFFSIFHYSNTHYPHYSPNNVKLFSEATPLLTDYLNSIRYFDRNLDEVFRMLKGRGELERTVIISVSDHSESVGEHISERGHFGKFNIWKTWIPFWIYIPPGLQNRFPSGVLRNNTQRVVCNNDAIPTLMNLYRLPVPAQMKFGQSLFTPVDKNRSIYIYNGPGENRTDSKEYFAAVNDSAIYIATKNGDNISNELFARNDDYQKNDLFKIPGTAKENYTRLIKSLSVFR